MGLWLHNKKYHINTNKTETKSNNTETNNKTETESNNNNKIESNNKKIETEPNKTETKSNNTETNNKTETESNNNNNNNNNNNKIESNNKKIETEPNKNFPCRYCNSNYKYKQSRWKHEQVCKNETISLKRQIEILTKKVDDLSKTRQTVTINNNTNNTIIINGIGKEDISFLSLEDKQNIMKAGLNSIFKLIEKLNFNTNKPENHNFCVTSINDKHASVINPDTNKIIKADKLSLFDSVAFNNFKKLESIANNPKFTDTENNLYNSEISKLKDMLFINSNGLKIFHSEINLLSYNNKDMILDTWKTL